MESDRMEELSLVGCLLRSFLTSGYVVRFSSREFTASKSACEAMKSPVAEDGVAGREVCLESS